MNRNDQLVSQAFSNQSAVFDRQDRENKLTEHLRAIYRGEILRQSEPGAGILELNCGTGIDTLFFAEKGYRLLSTDNAPGMIEKLKEKIKHRRLDGQVQALRCSFLELDQLGDRRFDHIISNFGGLNCTDRLDLVLGQLERRLNPGGKVTLVIMPRVSPWELVMALKGKFRTAFRRFRRHTPAHVEGVHFSVYYYSPAYVIRHMKQSFDLCTLKGIYFAVPPEFYQRFVERYPRMYRFLQKAEARLGGWFPFTHCCDHYMITLQKKEKTC